MASFIVTSCTVPASPWKSACALWVPIEVTMADWYWKETLDFRWFLNRFFDLVFMVDIVVNCAGYFYDPVESVGVGREGHLNFKHQLLQIDVCALGPLRITNALYKGGLLKKDGKPAKVIVITSQAGSCEWRFTQNPTPKPGDEFQFAM